MIHRIPSEVTNLDRYGHPELPWSRPRDILAADPPLTKSSFFLSTSRPDGSPHVAGVGALVADGEIYIVSGPETRKSRDLAANPACSLAVSLEGLDLVLDGEAVRVTDRPTLETAAAAYRAVGWPAEVEDDAFTAPYSAPSAGPPPWYLYRFTIHTAVGVAGAEPHGATRWRFDR